MLSTRDPLAVVVEMVTAVSLAPEHLEDRVDAIVDILIPELHASLGLLIRADVTHLDIQVLGRRLTPGTQGHMRQQVRNQLADPLLAPVLLGDLTPTTAARAFGADAWRQSGTRASVMVTFGIDQVATLPVHGGSDVVVFMVGRAGPDFTEEDLALLRAVQPVVTGLGMLLRLPRHTQQVAEPDAVHGAGLTSREVEVLELLAHGYKATVIARKAGCSTRTVHRHLGNIYDKLGVSDRLSAVNRAHTLGVIAGAPVDLS
ncbi:helix-turn-helix transcriptional regulator [Ornithinimicrobium cavernae]|uniref:helix-turn-helix transcriptional regulator n=1 Tax=Ornithinimicrobium cavernae TaxID=2666047 RepID=UPI0012B17301|nr:LuxR family transcriptional regulator [Ornithinimicrobium cavernae]